MTLLTQQPPMFLRAEFIVFIEMLEQDPGYLELTSSAGLEKLALLSELKETLSKHLAQVDDARAEFDKLVERNCQSSDSRSCIPSY